MNLIVRIPDDLAARVSGVDPARLERAALEAVRRAVDELEYADMSEGGDARTGEALISALQASPARDVDLVPPRDPLPVSRVLSERDSLLVLDLLENPPPANAKLRAAAKAYAGDGTSIQSTR